MTSTDRAKSFVSRRLKQTALVVLPLAAAAVQCLASVTFTVGNGSLNNSGGNSTTINTPFGSSPINDGLNGISLFGGATFTASGSGLGATPCGPICGGLSAGGGVTGTFDTDTLVVHYVFTPTDSNGDTINWLLDVGVAGSFNSAFGTVASGTPVDASFLLTGLLGATLPNTWFAQLEVDFASAFNALDTISIDIPADSSIDIQSQGGAPEPATLLLIGPALGGLMLFRVLEKSRAKKRSVARS